MFFLIGKMIRDIAVLCLSASVACSSPVQQEEEIILKLAATDCQELLYKSLRGTPERFKEANEDCRANACAEAILYLERKRHEIEMTYNIGLINTRIYGKGEVIFETSSDITEYVSQRCETFKLNFPDPQDFFDVYYQRMEHILPELRRDQTYLILKEKAGETAQTINESRSKAGCER